MSDDAKTPNDPTQESSKARRAKEKKPSDTTEPPPISQAVPPVVRRPRGAAKVEPETDASAPTPAPTPAPAASTPQAPSADPAAGPSAIAPASPRAAQETTTAPDRTVEKPSAVTAPRAAAPAATAPAKAARAAASPPLDATDRGPAGDKPVTITALDLEAAIASASTPSSTRKSRKSLAIRTSTEAAAGDDAAEPAGNAAPQRSTLGEAGDEAARRSRRTRRRGPGGAPGERAERRPERRDGPRRDGPRDDGPREGRRPRRDDRAADGEGATGLTSSRRIYRQDVSPHVAAAQAEAEREARAAERRRQEKENQDKITLILHPAPKAAKTRRKKNDRPRTAKEALKAKTAAKAKVVKPTRESAGEAEPSTQSLDQGWLEATAESAPAALTAAGTHAEALVKAWLDAGNVAALARASQLDSLSGPARKAARRAVNVLRARGVDVPRVDAAPPPRADQADAPVAMFIPPDVSGATFFSISQRQPGGRYHVVDVVVRSGVGVVHANSARLAGKHIRGWQSRVEKQFGAKPVEVSVAWARHVIARGRRLNDTSRQLVPLGFDSCASLLEPAPVEEPKHPLADLLADEPSTEDVEKAVANSDQLHAEPEFGSWLPDRAALDELLAKVGERVGSEGAKEPTKVDEAIRVEIAAATDRWFTPERRGQLADNMQDCAISLRARHGDASAQRVLRLARAIREAGLITAPPSEIPFLQHFFQKAVALLVRQNQGQLRVPIPAGM